MTRWLAALALLAAVPAQAAKVTVPFTVAPATVGTCPDDDGSSGATAGAPNYPNLITQGNYKASINGAHGLGCRVPGVDYAAGVPLALALKDPTTSPPTGCKYDGRRYLDCTSATVDGYDFAKNGTLLTGSGKMVITNSKFVFGSNCTDPVINVTGSLTLTHTTIDGTPGWTCNLNQGFGSFVNVNAVSGGAFVAEWNHLLMIAQDGLDINGASSGNYAVTIKYNVAYREGSTGHPDLIQTCGGGAGVLTPVVVSHNLWYGQPEPGPDEGGIQPIHIEAQICSGSGHIAKSIVAFNVILGTGKCNGGATWPVACSMNFGIAPKVDDKTSSNTGFVAYGNYIDWSGGIAAITNGYGVGSNAIFGTPYPNYDMTSGTVLSIAPAMAARLSVASTKQLAADQVARKLKIAAQMARLKVLESERKARMQ